MILRIHGAEGFGDIGFYRCDSHGSGRMHPPLRYESIQPSFFASSLFCSPTLQQILLIMIFPLSFAMLFTITCVLSFFLSSILVINDYLVYISITLFM